VLGDERILGGGEFVERIIEEGDSKIEWPVRINERRINAGKAVHEICKKEDI
jgi:hypothetical protein